jgi:hypothetical protein
MSATSLPLSIGSLLGNDALKQNQVVGRVADLLVPPFNRSRLVVLDGVDQAREVLRPEPQQRLGWRAPPQCCRHLEVVQSVIFGVLGSLPA